MQVWDRNGKQTLQYILKGKLLSKLIVSSPSRRCVVVHDFSHAQTHFESHLSRDVTQDAACES